MQQKVVKQEIRGIAKGREHLSPPPPPLLSVLLFFNLRNKLTSINLTCK